MTFGSTSAEEYYGYGFEVGWNLKNKNQNMRVCIVSNYDSERTYKLALEIIYILNVQHAIEH